MRTRITLSTGKMKLSCLLILSLMQTLSASNLVVTGFLEIPENPQSNFDFDDVEVFLINNEEKVVGRANPTENGFYLIPIDYKQDLKLIVKPTKNSYNFSPESHSLKLKGLSEEKADVLLKENSFNFKLDGFSLRDKVVFLGEDQFKGAGAQGVTIQLNRGDEVIGTHQTDKRGYFKFTNILPGKYQVTVQNTAGYIFKNDKMECQFDWDTSKTCIGQIQVFGTTMKGLLTIGGGTVAKAYALLRTLDNKSSELGCKNQGKVPKEIQSEQYSCHATIKNGAFSFDNLTHGKYKIKFVGSSKDGVLFENSILATTHNLESSSQIHNFNVVGSFKELKGRTQSFGGKPIKGVTIRIDGENKAVSNHNGDFVLKNIKFGDYDFEAIHEHFKFNPFQFSVTTEILKNNRLMPLTADFADLCGKIDYLEEGATNPRDYTVQVNLIAENTGDKRATKAAEDGSFCFELPQGTYLIEPSISYGSKKFNVLPKQKKVTIVDDPILGLDFSRERLTIKGTVVPESGTPADVIGKTKVILEQVDGTQIASVQYRDLQNGVFEFKDIFDEKYNVRIENPEICFDQQKVSTGQSSGNIRFVQKGIFITCKSSNDLTVFFTSPSTPDKKQSVNLKKGSNTVCLEHIESPVANVDSKYLMKNGMNNHSFKLQKHHTLSFEVEKIRFEVKVSVDLKQLERVYPNGIRDSDLLTKFKIDLTDIESGDKISSTKKLKDNVIVFTGYSSKERRIKAIPEITDSTLGSRLVVLQKEMIVNVGSLYTKNSQKEVFDVTIGKKIGFDTVKTIDDVTLNVMRRKNSNEGYSFLKTMKIDLSNSNTFLLNGNYDYNVELIKKGFELSVEKLADQNEDLIFKVSIIEISHISITIADDSGKPKVDILVYITSLSKGGPNSMKKLNSVTDKEGKIHLDIYKGQYYVKPVLKEYEFFPPQKLVTIEEGQTAEIDIITKRTQFSVFGSIRSFGKFPLNDIEIEAVSNDEENQLSERAASDKRGKFRIMGLIPGKKYQIKLRKDTGHIVMPETYEIPIEQKDTLDVTFILAEKWRLKSIAGEIKFSEDINEGEISQLLPIKVSLEEVLSVEEKEDPDFIADQRSTELHKFRRFEFADIYTKRDYYLRVRLGASSDPIKEIKISQSDLQIGINYTPTITIQRSDLNLSERKQGGSAAGLLVIVAGTIALYHFTQTKKA